MIALFLMSGQGRSLMDERHTAAAASQERAGELRKLPSVAALLQADELAPFVTTIQHDTLVRTIQRVLAESREAILTGEPAPSHHELIARVQHQLQVLFTPKLRPVINATGVILHTNLGRAPLSEDAAVAMAEAARFYTPLELELETGRRGGRMRELVTLLRELTGAEAALVVNNNAAAVLLVLSALCAGREVIVSRGQAVEIGGGFRIPDVLAQSGARLVEVGTTNRTYVRDYAAAIRPETAAILSVHWSNFRIVGFTVQPSLSELAMLAHQHGLWLIADLGSGALLDTARYGLAHEPMVQEELAAGADLVCFSGDKLLGGPQAGIIVGRRDLVQRVAAHPLARAVRADKTTLAGLAATLRHYLRGEAERKIPIWRMMSTPLEVLKQRCQTWQQALGAAVAADVVPSEATVGGGSLPGSTLPSWALAIAESTARARGISLDTLTASLRKSAPPVIARLEEHRLLFDARTILPEQDTQLTDILRCVFSV